MDARWDKASLYYAQAGIHIELYDAMMPAGNAQDVPFLIDQAQEVGGPVLELASGTGRVAWPMAETGFKVVGLDLNRGMIEAADAKRSVYPKDAGDRLRFVQGDMADFQLGRRFRFVYITYRSFQALLTPERQQKCLACIHRHLEPGGRLVINLFDPRLSMCESGYDGPLERQQIRNPVTGLMVDFHSLERFNDPLTQTFKMLWELREADSDGRVVRQEYERLDLRWTYRYEMRYLLERCGFVVLAEYSDFDKSPPSYGKEQVWVVEKLGAA